MARRRYDHSQLRHKDIEKGQVYAIRISGHVVAVTIICNHGDYWNLQGEGWHFGWTVRNQRTGRILRIKNIRRFRHEILLFKELPHVSVVNKLDIAEGAD